MSYHIITIDSPEAYITCRQGQLICDCRNGNIKQLPLEDVCSIVITSFSSSVHSQVLNLASEYGVAIIFCKDFKPQSILMPVNRSSDTILTKAFVEMSESDMAKYWQKTIDAKCDNQLEIAKIIAPISSKLEGLKNTCLRSTPLKESQCARYYWQCFGESILDENFRRNNDNFQANKLLDFGYSMLMSIVMQKIFAFGLDASYGIGHSIREYSVPLVYDLMEPFRPYIDYQVYTWLMKENFLLKNINVDTGFKQYMLKTFLKKVFYGNMTMEFKRAIEETIRSFRNAIKKHDISLYKPWTLKNSKWVG